MSRLTGSDTLGLFEAYQAIYSPQELTEEQVWEEVENWVNSLVEEGYDLSDYTWEEMYEAYLSEMGQTKTTGQSTAVAWKPTPGAGSAGGSGSGGRRGTGNSPGRLVSTSKPSAAPKPSFQQSGGYGRYSPGSQQVRIPSAPAKPTAAPAKPTAAPARPAVKPSGGTPPAAPKPTAAKTPTPTPRVKDTSITDMIGRSQVRQGAPVNTGNTSSDIRAIAGRASVGASPSSTAAKPTPSTPSLQQSIRSRRLNMDLDLFDVVKGYLLDEGYADTEEAALVIMANMSEEWREEILDERNRGEQSMTTQQVRNRRDIRDGGIPGATYERAGGSQKSEHEKNRGKKKTKSGYGRTQWQ